MEAYWITFTDKSSGCCEGESEGDATSIAEHVTGKTLREIDRLPYPASPIIWQFKHPVSGYFPSFCTNGHHCKGRTSCPCEYACTE